MLQLDIITIFPEYFDSVLPTSLLGKAIVEQKLAVAVHDLRTFAVGKHRLTDDRPYGGGPGMVMLIEPIDRALQHLGYRQGTSGEQILLTSAKGPLLTQQWAKELATLRRICLICGHYEGVDERVAAHLVDSEIRIGDYVLTGGEPAAAVVLDAVARLQPGVLGNVASLQGESHEQPGILAHPQYSRPEDYKGWTVPPVLKSGDHAAIEEFRQQQRKSA